MGNSLDTANPNVSRSVYYWGITHYTLHIDTYLGVEQRAHLNWRPAGAWSWKPLVLHLLYDGSSDSSFGSDTSKEKRLNRHVNRAHVQDVNFTYRARWIGHLILQYLHSFMVGVCLLCKLLRVAFSAHTHTHIRKKLKRSAPLIRLFAAVQKPTQKLWCWQAGAVWWCL